MIKTKTIDDINILIMSNWIQLKNTINKASIDYHSETGSFTFEDSYGNRIQNYSATIAINFEVFKLTEIGQTINKSDGTVIAYLKDSDVRELASNGFYEDGQTKIFDFMNMKFLIEI